MTTDKLREAMREKFHNADLKAISSATGLKPSTVHSAIFADSRPASAIVVAEALGLPLNRNQQNAAMVIRFRREHGLTPTQFTRMAGIGHSSLSLIENGHETTATIRAKVFQAISKIEKRTKKPDPVTLFETSYNESAEELKNLGICGDGAKHEPAPPVPPTNTYKAALLRMADLLEETGAKVVRGVSDIKIAFGFVAIETGEFELTAANVRRVAESIND